MLGMAWDWAKPGIMLPDRDWQAFQARIEALYGPRNKGRKKYLYTVAVRQLLAMTDDEIKRAVHIIEGEEHGVLPGETPEARSAAALHEHLGEASAREGLRPPAKRPNKKSG